MKCDSYPVLQALYLTPGGGGGEDGGGMERDGRGRGWGGGCLYDKFIDLYDEFQLSS